MVVVGNKEDGDGLRCIYIDVSRSLAVKPIRQLSSPHLARSLRRRSYIDRVPNA